MSRREDGQADDELRTIKIAREFTHSPGRVGAGRIRQHQVMCACTAIGRTALAEGINLGWLTAEYAMPSRCYYRARNGRESVKGKVGGHLEISRPGRTLCARASIWPAVGENTIALGYDVLQADGSTMHNCRRPRRSWLSATPSPTYEQLDAWLARQPDLVRDRAVSVGVVKPAGASRPSVRRSSLSRGRHERRVRPTPNPGEIQETGEARPSSR